MDKVGRYSEVLDAQIELLNYWGDPAHKYGDRDSDEALQLTVGMLGLAEAFYITPAICGLLSEAAQSIPESWIFTEESLYTPRGFVWLGSPINIPDEEGPVVGFVWASLDSSKHGKYVVLTWFDRIGSFPVPLPSQTIYWEHGLSLGIPVSKESKNPLAVLTMRRFFATLMSFLQQRILVTPKFSPDRMARRRFEKAMQKPPSNEVRVVKLRSIERRTGEGEHRDVEWTCQWIVHGHWRNQPYGPAGQKHYRPKWITPYRKGPENKPLRHPERLFAVVR